MAIAPNAHIWASIHPCKFEGNITRVIDISSFSLFSESSILQLAKITTKTFLTGKISEHFVEL